jgi:hypothetical protein
VQFEEYTTLNSALEGYGIHSVDEGLDKHLIRPEEEDAEHRDTFLDALKGLEAATKYMCQYHTENTITVTRNKIEIIQRAQEKNKRLLLNGYRNSVTR